MTMRGRMTRRDLIKRFGTAAFLLTPVARAMGYVAGGAFAGAPRFVMFFKGGSFHPASTNPAAINNLAGTPIAALQPHAQDIILFKNMNIHGGSPKTDGYQEEHAGGLIGCELKGGLAACNALYAAGADLADPYVSPLYGDFVTGFPPTLIQSGTRDLFLSNSVLMHRQLRRAGVEAELHVWEAMPHGGFGMGEAPENREIDAEVRRFIERWA